MAGQQIKITLAFDANTSKAKASMKDLQASLDSLVNPKTNQSQLGNALVPSLEKAKQSALDLKIALNNATSINTGKLNLRKFENELKRSGLNAKTLAANLSALGPQGQQAFTQVANAVTQASTKVNFLSGGMAKLMTTFTNTIRWQISAQAITNVMSSITSTIQFAKDLDRSLNNIQIVTNKSANEMARFGREANNAAKQLSTSTKAFTDASLIYFQQGLNDKAVKERTETTVKLANVTGKTAQEVSEWMTSIWNNFDDGSKQLSYYADVLTKLGAATASSASEIAGGLEKFAAISDTVGLSYEYAASALATITAQTRQSEDVVGTALKTIFSRMESLKLGETLEDGTSLGQYAAQIQKVGVSLKDSNGALKDMDQVLNELGAKWQTLGRDQQIALAQGVAGVRQYNQFIALMDNWDFMEENVEMAKRAGGTLEEQFKIYEDSAEGAQKRMQASAEGIKAILLGGEDLKGYYNFMDGFLGIIQEVLEATGGLPTIFLAIAAALSKVYQPKIASFFSQMPGFLKDLGQGAARFFTLGMYQGGSSKQDFKNTFAQEQAKMVANNDKMGGTVQSSFNSQNAALQQTFLENEEHMTASAKQRYQWEMQILELKQQQVVEANKAYEAASSVTSTAITDMASKYKMTGDDVNTYMKQTGALGRSQGAANIAIGTMEEAQGTKMTAADRSAIGATATNSLNTMRQSIQDLNIDISNVNFEQLQTEIDNFVTTGEGRLDNLINKFKDLQSQITGQGETTIANTEAALANKYAPATTPEAAGQIAASKGLSNITNAETLDKVTSSVSDKGMSSTQKEELKGYKDRAKALKDERKAIVSKMKQGKLDNKQREDLNRRLTENKRKTNDLSKEFKTFGKNLTNNGKNTKEFTEDLQGLGKQQQGVEQAYEGVTNAQNNLANSADDLQNRLLNGGQGLASYGDHMAGIFSGAVTALMGVNMLMGAADNLGKALGRGDATTKDWVSSLSSAGMAVLMLLPGITKVSKGLGGMITKLVQSKAAKKADTIATEGQIKVSKRKIAQNSKEEASENKGIFTKIKSAFAGVSKSAGKGWVGLIEAAASLAMIVGVLAAVGLSFNASVAEGKQEAEDEKGEKAVENYDSIKEAADKNKELVDSYDELLKKYKETGEGRDELNTKAMELVDAYDIEGGAALVLAGKYDTLAESIRQARNEELTGVFASASAAGQYTAGKVADSIRKGQGYIDNDKYTLNIGVGENMSEGSEVKDAILSVADKNKDAPFTIGWNKDSMANEGDAEKISDWYYYEILSGVDTTDQSQLVWAYDILQQIINEADKNIRKKGGIPEHYEEYNELVMMAQKFRDGGIEDLVGQRTSQGSAYAEQAVNDMDLANITNVSDFLVASDTLMGQTNGDYIFEKEMRKAISDNAYDPIFALIAETLSDQKDKADDLGLGETFKQGLLDRYKNASASKVRAMSSITLTEDMTLEDFDKQVEKNLLEGAKANTIATGANYKVTEEQVDAYTKALKTNRKELKDNTVGYKEYALVLEQVAEKGLRLNGQLEDFSKVWKDNKDDLKNGGQDYAFAVGNIAKGYQKLLNTNVDMTDFVMENLPQITAFMNGERGAYESLMIDSAKAIALSKGYGEDLSAMFTALDKDWEIGQVVVDDTGFYQQLEAMLASGKITRETLESILDISGFSISIDGDKITEIRRIADNTLAEWSSALQEQKKKTEDLHEKNKKTIEDLKEQKDRYEDINAELDNMADNLDKINKAKERAFGKDKIRLINEERNAIKAENDLLEQKQKQLEKDTKTRFNDISKYGYTFNAETGNIVNSNEVYDKMLKKYEAGLAAAGDNSDAQQDWKDWWDDFIDDTKKYNEALEDSEENAKKISDNTEKLLDLDYEELEYTVEINLQVSDWGLKTLERRLKNIEDDAFAAAEAIQIMGEQTDYYYKQFKTNQKGMEDLLKYKGATDEQIKSFMSGNADAISHLKLEAKDFELLDQYREGMEEALSNMEDVFDSIFEKLDEVFEAINEKYDNLNEKLEHTQNIITSISEIMDLVGSTNLGFSQSMVMSITDAALDIAQTQVSLAAAQKKKNEEMLSEAQAAYASAKTAEEKAKWEKSIELYEEQVRESNEQWLSSLTAALELGSERRTKAIEQAMESFLQETFGYKTMDELLEARTYYNRKDSMYIKEYEKAYQLSKLTRNINNQIDNTTSLKAKNQLLQLEEKINKIKNSNADLSQYELENLQKEYEIELARIALEDAKNAKSQVRLKRNAEGGMSYVYSGNTTEINKATQKLEDTIYNAAKSNDAQVKSIEDNFLQVTQTYLERLFEISTATYKSELERQSALDALNADYKNQLTYYGAQMGIALDNNENLFSQYVQTMSGYYDDNDTNFYTMFKDMYKNGDDFYTHFAQTTLPNIQGSMLGDEDSLLSCVTALVNKLGSTSIDEKTGKPTGKGLYNDLAVAQWSWENFVTTSFDNAGISVGNFSDNIEALAKADGETVTGLNNFWKYVDTYLNEGTDTEPGVKKIVHDVNEEIKTLQTNNDFSKAITNTKEYADKITTEMDELRQVVQPVNTALENIVKKWTELDTLPDKIEKEIILKYTESTVQGAGNGQYYSPGDDTYDNNINQWATLKDPKGSYDFDPRKFGTQEVQDTKERWGQIKDVATIDGKLAYQFEGWGEEGKWYDASLFNVDPNRILVDDVAGQWDSSTQFEFKDEASGYKTHYKYDKNTKTWYEARTYDNNSKIVENWDYWEPIEGQDKAFITNTDSYAYDTMFTFQPDATLKTKDTVYVKYKDKWYDTSKGDYMTNGAKDASFQAAFLYPEDALLDAEESSKILECFSTILSPPGGGLYYQTSDATYGLRIIKDDKNLPAAKGKNGRYYIYPNEGTVAYQVFQSDGEKVPEGVGLLYSSPNTKTTVAYYTTNIDGTYENLYMLKTVKKDKQYEYGVYNNKLANTLSLKNVSFDTGGYTGSWGPEGRWAMLHQKEIVLNEHDTENILSVVDLVRKMNGNLNMESAIQRTKYNQMLTAYTKALNHFSSQLEQTVTINAEFPNATDRVEITNAFENLINLAAQYASK